MSWGTAGLHACFGLAGILYTQTVEAQVCRGAAPFSNGRSTVGLAINTVTPTKHVTVDRGTSLGVEVVIGSDGGLFAGAGASTIWLSSPVRFVERELVAQQTNNATATVLGLTGGYAVQVSASQGAEICPLVGFVRQNGPEMWLECSTAGCANAVDGTLNVISLGGSAGMKLGSRGARISFTPFFGGALVISNMKAEGSAVSVRASEEYVGIAAGIGIVLQRVTIRPIIAQPIGLEGGESRFGLDLLVSMGRRGS